LLAVVPVLRQKWKKSFCDDNCRLIIEAKEKLIAFSNCSYHPSALIAFI